jgi:glyoxylase-like metal-dependent hydrolase (beta-lactamase superfamily II)
MRKATCLVVAAIVLALAPAAGAEEILGLPLHITKLAPTAIRLWVGDHISSTGVVAFATSKGIVVVDTIGTLTIDTEMRKVIARELGRSDFATLINTHEHGDHTGGNAVYADCAIVGHELVGPGMTSRGADRQRMLEWHTRHLAESEKKLEQLDPSSAEARALKERVTFDRLNLAQLKADPKPVPPTTTFSYRLTLDMGDTTFDMYYIGGMHSASDIAILVPEHGILLTGDTMADRWLNDTPGCLAAFMARDGVRHDFPRWLANWDLILARKDKIALLLPGHWNGELSLPGAEARVAYVRALWDGVNTAAKDGKRMSEFQAEYALDTRFASLAKSPGFAPRNHASTLMEMWKIAADQESAALKLYALIDKGAPESAIREVLAQRDAKGSRYYFVEGEINGHGYRFMQANQTDKAIAMFTINVELFPDAWNVYDSLGEALAKAGDTAGAVKMYRKSLALNPQSQSGKDALARLSSGATS